jgi:FkbM family methyltransferase
MSFKIKELNKKKFNNEDLHFCAEKNKLSIIPAGQQARSLYLYLHDHAINIDFFIDNSEELQGEYIEDIPVISFDEFLKNHSDSALMISTNEEVSTILSEQCTDNGFEDFFISVRDYLCFNSIEIDSAKNILTKNEDKVTSIYELFSDEYSRDTYKAILNYRVTGDNEFLEEVHRPPGNQYIEPEIYDISSADYIADCGAFDGDTLKGILAVTGEISGYYAFEPDLSNCSTLLDVAKLYKHIEVIEKGVYKGDTVLKFESHSNSLSRISLNDGIDLEVTSIDNYTKNKRVTFIKMDIEGSEHNALIGAINTIQKQKPVLAISVYHKFNDIWELPLLIESFGVDYNYFLRQYSTKGIETILYAVPKLL